MVAKAKSAVPLKMIKKRPRLGGYANVDFVAELFDAARQALRGSLLIGAGKIECSEIAIRHNPVRYAASIWSVPAAASPAGGRRFPDRPLVGIRAAIRSPVVLATKALCRY